jgi:S1-C subfamily serine protease
MRGAFLSSGLLVAFLALPNGAAAQPAPDIPPLDIQVPGTAQRLPPNLMLSKALPDVRALLSPSAARAKASLFSESFPRTRGPQDVVLFRTVAPSVVLILTTDALGSGSLLKDNTILTNYHVVGNERQVTVIFKPTDLNGKSRDDEIIRADVIKIDVRRDLALLRPNSTAIPTRLVHPLEISTAASIDVGTDVFAIGHPTGEAWTLTKGIVSAVRPHYEWTGGPGEPTHTATVIQTQTPINPGNSGGPLLTEDGKLVGVNSFGTKDTEGLNFAVSSQDVLAFLASADDGLQTIKPCDQARTLFEGRNAKNDAFIRTISVKCDDKADIVIVFPDKKTDSIVALVDLQRRGKTEGIVFDEKRSGRWNISYWDPKFDDTFPLRGTHPDGGLMPTRFEQRCRPGFKPAANLKCTRA